VNHTEEFVHQNDIIFIKHCKADRNTDYMVLHNHILLVLHNRLLIYTVTH